MRYLRELIKVIMIVVTFFILSWIIDILLFYIFNNWIIIKYAIYIEGYIFIWIFVYMLTFKDILKQNKLDSLYEWLDKRNNSPLFIKEMLSTETLLKVNTSKSFMGNLEVTYNAILVYTNHDIKKLRMLRAYMRSLNTENGPEVLGKMILQLLIGPIIILLVNKGYMGKVNLLQSINPSFTVALNIATGAIIMLAMVITLVNDLFAYKKRNKIIEEMIDACIENLK
ncbi:hypothetical protein ACWZQY_024100 [Priestia megaterium]